MPTDDDFEALARLLQRPLGPVDRRALELWQEREEEWALRLRRYRPDAIDLAGGVNSSWQRAWRQAFAEVAGPHRA